MRDSIKNQIRNYLLGGNTLTALAALKRFNTMRLAAYIHLLRREMDISSRWKLTPTKKNVKEYYILKK